MFSPVVSCLNVCEPFRSHLPRIHCILGIWDKRRLDCLNMVDEPKAQIMTIKKFLKTYKPERTKRMRKAKTVERESSANRQRAK